MKSETCILDFAATSGSERSAMTHPDANRLAHTSEGDVLTSLLRTIGDAAYAMLIVTFATAQPILVVWLLALLAWTR
jgi:hypothetical protein